MVHLPELAKLKITELNKDNIDSVIKAIKDSPKELFDTISKKALIDIYYQVKELLKEEPPEYFI